MLNLEQALEVLQSTQINIQLEFSQDKDGYVLFNLRCLPWRNTPRQGYMILVADHSLTQVLCRAAEDLESNRWSVLNWKIRLMEPGHYFGYGGAGLLKDTSTASELPSVYPRPLHLIKDTSDNGLER